MTCTEIYRYFSSQRTILYRWPLLLAEQRMQLRDALYAFYASTRPQLSPSGWVFSAQYPNCVRNKAAKVLVELARIAWPHEDPQFFPFILEVYY